jgi:hypothetical protein
MAQAILALQADPSRARAMAAGAQAWALEHHVSWAADRFAALYREVAGR